ncbi:A-kinase anchor protein 7 isoform X3 [Hypomesus transpacificus]|uniref:A-kinase anchor protein 7 isoform X3 n=1 Tax=Hypomesus transpacificus TaxID=137520 RepID=UPI001F07E8A0|nr:A-kinase anchor protein 7 isoform X3 [Hypomesus transpacificus]
MFSQRNVLVDMFARHSIIISVRGICALRRGFAAACIAERVAQSLHALNRVNSTTTTRQNTFLISVFAWRRVKLTDMLSASIGGAGSDAGGLETGTVHDCGPLSVSTGGAAPLLSGPRDCHLQHRIKEAIATDGKVKRTNPRARRAWGRRPKESECDSVMSELPFSSASSWKDLGFTSPREKQRKRRRGESGRVDSEEDAEKKRLKKETLRPNYFVSIPITNSKISEGVADVQEAVLEKDPRLARVMIPIGTLHLTLLVTHLANQDQVDLAASALTCMEAGLAGLLGGRDLVLPFSGIGTFRNEVAFVELAPGGHTHTLAQLADLTRTAFEEKGLSAGDSRDFKPHLTFMKLSRAPKLRSQGVKKLDPGLYSCFSQQCFGEERVVRLDLCSMLKKKTPDGYYHTDGCLHLKQRARSALGGLFIWQCEPAGEDCSDQDGERERDREQTHERKRRTRE